VLVRGADGFGLVMCGTHHEITLDVTELVRETLLLGVVGGSLNLVVVVVQSDDVGAGELDHFSRGTADTAAHV